MSNFRTYSSENNPTTPGSPQSKTHLIHQQVHEVVGIMQENIDKVMEREERLESLQSKTDDLNQGALQFKRGASKVRKQMWWRDMKLKIILAVVVIILLIVIIVPIVVSNQKQA